MESFARYITYRYSRLDDSTFDNLTDEDHKRLIAGWTVDYEELGGREFDEIMNGINKSRTTRR